MTSCGTVNWPKLRVETSPIVIFGQNAQVPMMSSKNPHIEYFRSTLLLHITDIQKTLTKFWFFDFVRFCRWFAVVDHQAVYATIIIIVCLLFFFFFFCLFLPLFFPLSVIIILQNGFASLFSSSQVKIVRLSLCSYSSWIIPGSRNLLYGANKYASVIPFYFYSNSSDNRCFIRLSKQQHKKPIVFVVVKITFREKLKLFIECVYVFFSKANAYHFLLVFPINWWCSFS